MNPRSIPSTSRPQTSGFGRCDPGLPAGAGRPPARPRGWLAAVALAALAAPAAHAAESYVGIGLGSGRQDVPCVNGQPCDRSSSGSFKAFLGVEPTPRLGVEAMAWRLGAARAGVAQGSGLQVARTRSEGLALSAVARAQVDAWTFKARLGVGYATGKAELASGARVSTSQWALVPGVGVSYALDKRWTLHADADKLPTRYTPSTQGKADLYTVGLSYRF